MWALNSILLADAGVWYAFDNSDAMGKGIVVLLFLSSMLAWHIMLEKGLTLYRAQKLSERFAAAFTSQPGMTSVLRDGMENPCPVAQVYISGMEQLLEFYGQTAEEVRSNAPMRDGRGPRKLSPAQLDAVATAMEREISGQIFVIEKRIGTLATAVSLAPFLGLFGTVWGVMIAFCGVASQGSANIQALAPGVAGALLTTVAGLVVAIPALVGYNIMTQMIRKITVSMDNFSETFMAKLKLEQLTAPETPSAARPAAGVKPAAAMPTPPPIQQRPAAAYTVTPQTQTVNFNQQPSGSMAGSMPGQTAAYPQYQTPPPRPPMPAQSPVQQQTPPQNYQVNAGFAPVPPMPDAAPRQMTLDNMDMDQTNADDSMRG